MGRVLLWVRCPSGRENETKEKERAKKRNGSGRNGAGEEKRETLSLCVRERECKKKKRNKVLLD